MSLDYEPQFSFVPKRIRRCPECGSNSAVKSVIWGMPSRPPTDEERERVIFGGCEMPDGEPAEWWCSACETGF